MFYSTQQLGQVGEAKAAQFLSAKGFTPLATNYRCKYGEIDLVAQKGSTTVFVEVKTRSKQSVLATSAMITKAKKIRMTRAVKHFLQAHPEHCSQALRMDVAILVGNQKIQYLENAFYACY